MVYAAGTPQRSGKHSINGADTSFQPHRVAIVHYWLVGMRGGEKVLEELVEMFPQAEIFTHVVDRGEISPKLASRRIHETSISRLPFSRRLYNKYIGFMPRALEEIDLSGFELVISSESGPAKGVVVPPGCLHVCYIHTPMRYIWDHYPIYRSRLGFLGRAYFSRVAHYLRTWDVTSAQRVDLFIANSNFVASRVLKYYRREAQVVHPPVNLERFSLAEAPVDRRKYLFVSELVPYKRADLVIDAFRGSARELTVIGDGPELKRLRREAPPNVELVGHTTAEDLVHRYQNAVALVFPGEEDFGIVPLEAMACGTPIIGYGSGGLLDTCVDGKTGMFFYEQSATAIKEAIDGFESSGVEYSAEQISRHANAFSPDAFKTGIRKHIETAHRRLHSDSLDTVG